MPTVYVKFDIVEEVSNWSSETDPNFTGYYRDEITQTFLGQERDVYLSSSALGPFTFALNGVSLYPVLGGNNGLLFMGINTDGQYGQRAWTYYARYESVSYTRPDTYNEEPIIERSARSYITPDRSLYTDYSWTFPDYDWVEMWVPAFLFTDGSDRVNFNSLTSDQRLAVNDGADLYGALAGNDTVVLPGTRSISGVTRTWDPGRAFSAGDGNDTITGGQLADNIHGDGGNDTLRGYGQGDRLGGGAGADTLNGGGGNDDLQGDVGQDILRGEAGDDLIDGGDGQDTLHGGLGLDRLEGGAANDELYGSDNADILLGGQGNDALRGGQGNDRLFAHGLFGDVASGHDRLWGEQGDDFLVGGAGNDELRGGAGRDTLTGQSGNDLLMALDDGAERGAGDSVVGGRGRDLIQVDHRDVVADLEVGDRLQFLSNWSIDNAVFIYDGQRTSLYTYNATFQSQEWVIIETGVSTYLLEVAQRSGFGGSTLIEVTRRPLPDSGPLNLLTIDPVQAEVDLERVIMDWVDAYAAASVADGISFLESFVGKRALKFFGLSLQKEMSNTVKDPLLDLVAKLGIKAPVDDAKFAAGAVGLHLAQESGDVPSASRVAQWADLINDTFNPFANTTALLGQTAWAGVVAVVRLTLDPVVKALEGIRVGTGANETRSGTGAPDILYLKGGNDTAYGRDGDDLVIGGSGAGSDIYDGGRGRDTVLYVSTTAGVTADLAQGTASGRGIDRDRLVSIENASGGSGHDRLTGSDAANRLWGEDGHDRLLGGAGDDVLEGGAGNDHLSGAAGRDRLLAGAGADVLDGGAGADNLQGGTDAAGDHFVFSHHSHSAPGAARDVIRGFTPEADQIDLRSIDARIASSANDAFLWSNTTAAAHSVWWSRTSEGVVLRADVTGNTQADMEVLLRGVSVLEAQDVLL
ncbi:calcium-binding protein [Rubellimicrobium rubrum]|uniref:Calcium-binding protein n=1 Tax=Rubellimicrobium rubrum TaxID=2585369 RepID=A0A5C4MTP6_9RHOB|nr:calcium-binding protein [Rubellimicrobium rubrum]TNC47720.1 calcium-binding protein [Rubellimicrobium rubrum]